ncbi:unnamed protein product [Parnassius apollo]|uniref:(apollo) hypothetical protein n=2 Tax=Parnassius apollo TaxID=110799 RepID=A0A8S3X0P2_PARAO|nr:unnamed protein product [Parnassius apollo]
MMDVLVTWKDGTQNVVHTRELFPIRKGQKITLGTKVKMLYERKWWYGTVTVVEAKEYSSSEDEPLSTYVPANRVQNCCEYINCHNPILTTCTECACFLCAEHYQEDASCSNHILVSNNISTSKNQDTSYELSLTNSEKKIYDTVCTDENYIDIQNEYQKCSSLADFDITEIENVSNDSDATMVLSDTRDSPSILMQNTVLEPQQDSYLAPEDFIVDGVSREEERSKPVRKNKYKEAKVLRHAGQEYISPYTKKVVPGRKVGSLCNNLENCTKQGLYCYRFNEQIRENIFMDFYSLADLTLQREYIVRFVEKKPVGRKTTATESRRKFTNCFYLPLNDEKQKVCKKMFLNTLGISEKTFRTALQKLKNTGVVEKDRRGGRQEVYHERDTQLRSLITEHINRFPRVESHYCRKSSTKEYLHHDLSLKKIYGMFLKEYNQPVSMTLYRNVFKGMNLSFHKPKKDQCSLCMTYREGTSEVKEKLQNKYDAHIIEKEEVRRIKNECKNRAIQNITTCCASFDLQQVIYLPQSNESALFYKRRLANYNFTIYDLASKDCICNLWNETISRRGASEISTCVYYFLTNCDRKSVKEVFLFCDGCSGQNKNSVMAAMLLYLINNCESIEEISLRYFCSFHGQSEGDSVHSAIAFAMAKAGNVFVPCQLEPIIRLARKNPYEVKVLNYNDFKDFKNLALKLRLLKLKNDNQTAALFKWTDVMELKVSRKSQSSLFFKTSHKDKEYRSISIKRQDVKWLKEEVGHLNKSHYEISKEKI